MWLILLAICSIIFIIKKVVIGFQYFMHGYLPGPPPSISTVGYKRILDPNTTTKVLLSHPDGVYDNLRLIGTRYPPIYYRQPVMLPPPRVIYDYYPAQPIFIADDILQPPTRLYNHKYYWPSPVFDYTKYYNVTGDIVPASIQH